MKKSIIAFLIITILFVANYSSAQQGLTLYNMDRVLQSQWINPSSDLEYNVHIGGIIIPVFGQLPLPMYMNYANNSFYYNHLLHMGEGAKADNLVINTPKFMNSLRRTTHMRFSNQIELINFGIKLDDHFISFAITEKFNYGISLPYDFFEFVVNGNKPYMREDKPHDFSGLGIYATHYREYALGFATEINPRLNVGIRGKLLFGKGNMSTDINKLSLYTDGNNGNRMTLTTDMAVRSSMPFYFDYVNYGDSIDFDINEDSLDEITPQSYLLNRSNVGFAFDLGGTYQLTREIDLFASVTDLGLITWNTNPQSFISRGEFEFRGIEIKPFADTDEDDDSMEQFADTLMKTFSFELQEGTFVTWLPSSFYVGGMYKYHEKLHLGALFRAEFYKGTLLPSFSVSANSNLTSWFSAHVSYSVANNYWGNVGLGFTTRLGFVNWFVVTDNLTGMIFPQKLKNFNIRFGCNLVFGRGMRESQASFSN